MKKLTIGMPCFDDYDGVYFTIKSLQIYHPMNQFEILVVDSNPESEDGKATAHFCKGAGIRYIPAPQAQGTAQAKQLVFEYSETPYVMCMDCHVLFDLGAIAKLIRFLETDDGNLLQGPLIYDDGASISTHMKEVWRGGSEGIWATDRRGTDSESPAFEIPAQGMGVFACRREAWSGFHPLFRGFGGEEFYIHRKFRFQGRKVLCLPFLRWHHRFGRPGGVPYPNILEDRIFNYVVGHLDLGMNINPIREHFSTLMPEERVDRAGLDALVAFRRWRALQEPLEQILEETQNSVTV